MKLWSNLQMVISFKPAASVEVSGKGKRTYQMIYEEIAHLSPCIRRMNATHQIGCSSDFNGNTGVLHLIEEDADIDWLNVNGSYSPYIAFFSAAGCSTVVSNIEKLLATKKISGILVDHSNRTRNDIIDDESFRYSSDRSCPNDNFVTQDSLIIFSTYQKLTIYFKNRETSVAKEYMSLLRNQDGLVIFPTYQKFIFKIDSLSPFSLFNASFRSSILFFCRPLQWNRPRQLLVGHVEPHGTGSNFEVDFGVPVLALTSESEVEFIKECYYNHNHPDDTEAEYPLCAMELKDFMHGVKDTPTCMWRTQRTSNLEISSYCDPIGDKNVWGFAKNSDNSSSYKSVILAASPLDATSLFYGLFPRVGAESVVTSFVPLLAAAEAIGKISQKEKDTWEHDVMFALFNTESYDYSGSSRMVYDMMRGYFPTSKETIKKEEKEKKKRLPQMNVTDISYVLELRQLGLSNGTYYAHVDPISQADEGTKKKTDDLIKILQGVGPVEVNTVPADIPLPPASFQQFLKTGINIPGVVLTDHEREYNNRFYNSRYDFPYDLGVDKDNKTEVLYLAKKLNKVAETVAKTLVSLAGGDESSVKTDVTTVNDLLFCFLVNANCSLFRSLQQKADVHISPIAIDLYPGVWQSDTQGSILTTRLLAYFLGEKTAMNETDKDDCSKPDDSEVYTYHYAIGPEMNPDKGICIKSTVHITAAVSPAFIDDEHTKPDWASTKYSTWTQSQWSRHPSASEYF
ncbi:putative nicastrin isoform X2 [Apostichopus japonicus]|uniref:Nicastrin n=1 Tax=Stichopus japonicus TaxID=307972 RepID=A0A2G8KKF0_STIJA|nr:putative nicastrin isoform X2 [Apostichopus japonicus]